MAKALFSIDLRIKHPTLEHESIAQALALDPAFGWSVGEQRKTPKGTLLEGINKESYCYFKLISKQAGDFTEGIKQIIPLLDTRRSYLQNLPKEGGKAELYVGIFAEGTTGFTLDIQDMAMLVNFALELSVEVYY